VLGRLRGWLIGAPRNLFDPRIHHHLALITFFAWVGLGSDGLSSSSYGPEEAFLQLGTHRYLAVFLMVAMVATVFLISASYSQIIELFPTGGGGYLVATKLLGPVPGIVSGSVIVFAWTLSAFATPELLGGGRVKMIANVVRDLALDSFNWPGGAAFALMALAVTLALLAGVGKLTAVADRGA